MRELFTYSSIKEEEEEEEDDDDEGGGGASELYASNKRWRNKFTCAKGFGQWCFAHQYQLVPAETRIERCVEHVCERSVVPRGNRAVHFEKILPLERRRNAGSVTIVVLLPQGDVPAAQVQPCAAS
jgi:hypothetical protein